MVLLLKFAFVGSVGFIIDTCLFAVLFKWLSLDLMLSRSIAFLFTATITWLGNRWLTFSQSKQTNMFAQWQKFMITACVGAIPNFAVFKTTTLLLGTNGIWVYTALIMGIFAGMISNYVLSTKWVFR